MNYGLDDLGVAIISSELMSLKVILPRANRLYAHEALRNVALISDLMELKIEDVNRYLAWGVKKSAIITAWQELYKYCILNNIQKNDPLSQVISIASIKSLDLFKADAELTVEQLMTCQYAKKIPKKRLCMLEDIGMVFQSILKHTSLNTNSEDRGVLSEIEHIKASELFLILPLSNGISRHPVMKSIQTVPEFLAFSPLSLSEEYTWGQKKTSIVIAWQQLYSYCCSPRFNLEHTLSDVFQTSHFEALSLCSSRATLSLRDIESGRYPKTGATKNLNMMKNIQSVLRNVTMRMNPHKDKNVEDIFNQSWIDIPVREIKGQLRKVLLTYEIKTIGELYHVIRTDQITSLDQQQTHKLSEFYGIGKTKISKLQKELDELLSVGIEAYRFGSIGHPKSISMLIAILERDFKEHEMQLIQKRSHHCTLKDIGDHLKCTRERIRQLESDLYQKSRQYKDIAESLVGELHHVLIKRLIIPMHEALSLIHCDDESSLKIILYLFYPQYDTQGGSVSYLEKYRLKRLKAIGRLGLTRGYIEATPTASLHSLINNQRLSSKLKRSDEELIGCLSQDSLDVTWQSILAVEDFKRTDFKSQLTLHNYAFHQANGRFLDELNSFCLKLNAQDWQDIINEKDLFIIDDDRLILRTKLSEQCLCFVKLLQQEVSGIKPKDTKRYDIFDHHRYNTTALYVLYECIQKDDGGWIHACKQGLTARDVFDIMQWGYKELLQNSSDMDMGDLFETYTSNHSMSSIESPRQLASIVNKHINVRRTKNRLYCLNF